MTVTAVLDRPSARTAPGSSTSQSPTGPRLRRLPLPRTEPPYDDELDAPAAPAVHPNALLPRPGCGSEAEEMLPLSFVLPSGLPVIPQSPAGATAFAPSRRARAGVGLDGDFDPQPTPRSALPEPRGWAARLVQAMVEVVAGDRPSSQLVRWTSEDVYQTVRQQVSPSADRRPAALAATRAVVRSVHVCEPADGVAEACALVQRGARATAIALRLEGVDGRWQCTALEFP